MDPPLHYAPIDSLDSLQVIAGITPVSQGGDSIAGTVIADAAAPQFNSAPGYKGKHAFGSLHVRAYWHDIDHLMDNYSLRPNAGMKMFAPATSQDTGISLDTRMGRAKFGLEYRMNDFNAYSQNAVTAARKDMFRDSARDRLGVYGEWLDNVAPDWTLQVGLRGDMVRMNTGTILTGYSASSSAAQRVQPNFNGIDRSRTDYNIDATLLTRYQPNPASVYEFGLAQKTRSPSTLERYLWSSQQSSAGQADGYNYLGNVDLKPEVSRQITTAAQWKTGAWNHRAEFNLAARQNKVSAYNQERPTSGYGVVNLRTRWQASKALRLTAGVENLFDRTYYDHLGGINRVTLSSVAIGGQLPGMGRSLYVGMEYAL